MNRIEVQKQSRITLSPEARQQLHIREGDLLAEEVRDGQVVLTPLRVIEARSLWFLASHWQKGEREAGKDIQAGRLHGPFKSAKALLHSLNKK